ncbi:MAG: TIGR02186 family protein [Nitrospirae bacterium]|nr:TIGR02186 family protein [Nitrospirota bacterium]
MQINRNSDVRFNRGNNDKGNNDKGNNDKGNNVEVDNVKSNNMELNMEVDKVKFRNVKHGGLLVKITVAAFVFILAYTMVCFFGSTGAQASLTMSVEHKTIPINAFYNGNTVLLKGMVDKGEDVVVKLSSDDGKETFMTKGKSAHLFWMNKNKITISGISSVYMLFSSKDVESAVSEADRDKYVIGYGAVEKRAVIVPAGDKARLLGEFIKLKEKNRLYDTGKEKISLIPAADGKFEYTLQVKLSYQVQPGQYKVEAYGVKNGAVSDTASDAILVEPVGIVKAMTQLASRHGALYGLMSIVIALIAGLMVTPSITFAKVLIIFAISFARRIATSVDNVTESVFPLHDDVEESENVMEHKALAEQKHR